MGIGTSYFKTMRSTPRTSITRGNFPLGDLGLGKLFPSNANGVTILDFFIFNKIKGTMVKKSFKKIKLQGFSKLMATTQKPLMVDTRMNPITTTSAGVTFSQVLEFNIGT
jgi:hypothetical protein